MYSPPPTVQRNTRQGKTFLGRGFLKKILTKAREKQCFVSKEQICVKLLDGQGEHMQLRDAPAKPALLILTMCGKNEYFHTLHVVVATCPFCLLFLY